MEVWQFFSRFDINGTLTTSSVNEFDNRQECVIIIITEPQVVVL